jgi:hypothetical protein
MSFLSRHLRLPKKKIPKVEEIFGSLGWRV